MRHVWVAVVTLALAFFGCAKPEEKPAASAKPAAVPGEEPAKITMDGSSSLFPISSEVVRRYKEIYGADIELAVSGTSGGFNKFCKGDIDIAGASRAITSGEVERCKLAGVEFIEMPVAFDGIAVVVNKDNDWVESLTVAELEKLWEPAAQGTIKRWSDMREGWPNVPIHLYGPGSESGTFDYFTLAVNGEAQSSRNDYRASEDDDKLVDWVAIDGVALGYFSYAYYQQNEDRLRVIAIDDGDENNGAGPVVPSRASIKERTYQPLSRPLFVYIKKSSAERKAIEDFVHFYLEVVRVAAQEVGYVQMPQRVVALSKQRFDERTPGSAFEGVGARVAMSIEDLMTIEVEVPVYGERTN